MSGPAVGVCRRFEGRVAVVVGGGHGIGLATARRLAAEGARVTVLDLREAEQAAAGLAADGLAVTGRELDVTRPDAVRDRLAEVRDAAGEIDVLVNSAGRLALADPVALELDDWRHTFAVNLDAVLLAAQAVLPAMIDRGGSIVSVASIGGLRGGPGTPAYNASKAAVVNLTRSMAAEYGRHGVRVNSVCPGWVPTGFNDPLTGTMTDAQVEQLVRSRVPLGRQGTAEEIAATIAFLASDDAAYVTGHALVVDGGLTATF
ncbi:meso-butanediol dehydrogenase / (S,S)-butanediol dehydrogenase / diacetyl reductase [Jatrophihabitans endophyticus]|uniref:Meso-butanediol dehydrogenase / (S,S)-butanediol dehydrogenase / diacetyl reductase n=1 Tax=Jatrophihabitans endophyticus TaxID=1206085 RepID=A0A1M5PX10_9ACTN|nr:SDR family oxidoreductase [Jatrophihabitans endophyticus]SHH06334.1 meso-butanediol dehydrogenase / (S,S)-butanediol dehydrogenase / diacetyl reductase [Jatrophihabitans endophyticus]